MIANNFLVQKHPTITAPTTELWLSDVHFTDHDPEAWRLACAVTQILQPDILFHGGDIWDFYQFSRFDQDPRKQTTGFKEIEKGHRLLENLWACSTKSQKIYISGNHEEERWQKWLWRNAPKLVEFPQVAFKNILGLDPKDIKIISHGTLYKIGDLYHAHGDEFPASRTNPARDIFNSFNGSIIFGHHHTFSLHYHQVRAKNQQWGSFGIGCLRTLNPEYVKFPQWQQGVARIFYTIEGLYHVDQIPFFRTKRGKLACVLDGKLITV